MKSVSEKELAMLIAVAMAADGKHAPVLRGKNAAIDPVERDQVRQEFAKWVARLLMSSNLVILQRPPSTHGPFPGTRALGTPPQMR